MGAKYVNKRIGSKISAWHKEGKKVILLPQAFGSFEDEELKDVMKKIIANADLVFAREKQSLKYLRRISEKNNIILAPDFTNLIEGKVPENFDSTNRQVAIIPNYKMIDKGDAGNFYIDFLCLAINKINAIGLRPDFLLHEGQRDIQIA